MKLGVCIQVDPRLRFIGPIGSKVIEVKGQIYVVFLFVPPRSLGRSSPKLVGRLMAAPDITSRGSFLKVKVIEVKGQISVSRQSLVRFA